MVGNLTEAEDLTQEAFLLVFRKIQTFRGESPFSTWLHRLALNVVLMHLRKKKLTGVPLGKTTRREEESAGPCNEVFGLDLTLTGLVYRVNLERAVEHLPEPHIVFVLHGIQGYRHHESAQMMDLSVGTSKDDFIEPTRRLRQLLVESQYHPALVPGNCDKGTSVRVLTE